MGEPKEEEEEDKEEEPTQAIDGDNTGEEVIKVLMPEAPKTVWASARVSPAMTIQDIVAIVGPMEESNAAPRE